MENNDSSSLYCLNCIHPPELILDDFNSTYLGKKIQWCAKCGKCRKCNKKPMNYRIEWKFQRNCSTCSENKISSWVYYEDVCTKHISSVLEKKCFSSLSPNHTTTTSVEIIIKPYKKKETPQ
jgi:hypothetical protein